MVIFKDFEAQKILREILHKIHTQGPCNAEDLETLAYIKKYNLSVFKKYEQTLLYLLGLFYKVENPKNLFEMAYKMYADEIVEDTKHNFTPVQASAYHNIKNNRVFSFSAPTSIGKSYLFRELLKEYKKDIVIIVPSRALLAEYMHKIKSEFENDKSILILQFIENINILNTNRRIYIITPERSGNLFKLKDYLNIELFLFDEAQDLEDELRQVRFDALVRRINKEFPKAKIVFTQPFANNPDAQLIKHSLNNYGVAQNYKQLSIGKICIEENNRKFYYFSPYRSSSIRAERHTAPNVPIKLLKKHKTILIYISKNKIYKGKHLEDFKDLISLCPPLTSPEELHYIQLLQDYIGSSEQGSDKNSMMIQMMKRGIVIHHGSIPLKARLIIEEFVNKRFAKICFATSTLLQGINMPFDAVWIDNFHNLPPLALKNLIGRAGRTTTSKQFNFGYVIIKSRNRKLFEQRINDSYAIKNTSFLNSDIKNLNEDIKDIVEAIQDNTFNDEYQLTNKQVERLQIAHTRNYIEDVLNTLFTLDGKLITEQDYHKLPKIRRELVKNALKNLYSLHLRRRNLTPGEQAVLSTAIPIILWRVQGKSFKEILALRYAFISRKDEQTVLKQQVDSGTLTKDEVELCIKNLPVRWSPIAQQLPNQRASLVPLFAKNTSVMNINYDLLVYDTYDYIDKVISLSIANSLSAAFSIYFNQTQDIRAEALMNYIKYGTNNSQEIWLLRYGFSFDDIEWIKPYIKEINEDRIVFYEKISSLPNEKLSVIKRFNV